MRVLSDKEMQKLVAAADKIVRVVEPLERRIAALEAAAGQPAPAADTTLAARVARLERVEQAARTAGAS
jgi:hypothetical protein